jgi:hypothetical protein
MTGIDPEDATKSVRQFPTAAELQKAEDDKAAQEGREPVKVGLNPDELLDYAALLFAANAGWKSDQAARGRNDLSRVDAFLRGGVYDRYENLIRPNRDADTVDYNIAKDGWELLEKGQKLLEEPAPASA